MNTITHLETKELSCIRQGKNLFPPVSFLLQAGEVLLVEGANGAGKSSLLRLLARAATPASGNIFWKGVNVDAATSEYTEQLHYLGHANGIRLGLTVGENLHLASDLAQQAVTNLDAILALLQLNTVQHTQTQFLSAGQKRRAALARIFLLQRSLWILDEPFTSLDAATQKILLAKITEHLARGGMCVITSHQPLALELPIQSLRLAAC
jgi:heme exporter protein A